MVSGMVAARNEDEVICPLMVQRDLVVPAHHGVMTRWAQGRVGQGRRARWGRFEYASVRGRAWSSPRRLLRPPWSRSCFPEALPVIDIFRALGDFRG